MSNFTISRRELYILPTKIGWYYIALLFALFAIAVKFDNQPAFIMLFLLISISLVAMLYTHNNVINLSISKQPAKNIFCGEQATFPVTLSNNSNKHRHFCWSKRFKSQERCLVYPQPMDLIEIPDNSAEAGKQEQAKSVKLETGDYAGMKMYQPGDRLRDIHWPSLAKTQKLITIEHEVKNNSSVNLSWFSLPSTMNVEDKLSQLCYWLLEANKQAAQYQLEMPNHVVEFNQGNTHLHECLTVLALWGNSDD